MKAATKARLKVDAQQRYIEAIKKNQKIEALKMYRVWRDCTHEEARKAVWDKWDDLRSLYAY